MEDEPAFPAVDHMGDGCLGMTLRAYFAAKAMAAIHANEACMNAAAIASEKMGIRMSQYVARQAWQMADEMIEEGANT